MTVAPPHVRAAKAALAEHRRAQRKARPPRVAPTAAGQRRERKLIPGFLAFVRRQPCAVGPAGCNGPVQAAHIRTPRPGEPPTGLQRKPDDDRCTPLCAGHHAEQHSQNEMKFWRAYGIDPFAVAGTLFKQFQEQGK